MQLRDFQIEPKTNSNQFLNMQQIEKNNMISLTHLSNEGIVAKLEEQRFERLKKAASNLKSQALCDGRCPLCTLPVPCKHFTSETQMYQQRQKLFKTHEWGLLSQDNRNALIKLSLKIKKESPAKFRAKSLLILSGIEQELHDQSPMMKRHSLMNGNASATNQSEHKEPMTAIHLPIQRNSSNLMEEGTPKNNNQGSGDPTTPQSNANRGQRASVRPGSFDATSREKKRNTEVFLTRVRVNALKNEIMQKQGKKPLTLEQRRQIEDQVQAEVLEF